MKSVTALAVIAGLVGAARADISHIDLKLRPWGSSGAWSDSLTLQSANLVDPIAVEVGAFYIYSSGYGLSTVNHNIVGSPYSAAQGDLVTLLDRTDSAQHPDGRMGNFNFGGQKQDVFHTGTSGVDGNRFRVADSLNENNLLGGGISIKQAPPTFTGLNFDTSNPALAYHFKLSLACYNGGAARTVTIDSPLNRIYSFRVYDTVTSQDASNSPFTTTDPASVTVSWIPAPGVPCVLGAGVFVLYRRRRVGFAALAS